MIEFELPWPDKCLSPNAKRRLHWSRYNGAIRAARQYGRMMMFAASTRRERDDLHNCGRLPFAILFVPPDRRKRDDDGMIGAFKHYRDGIADALGVDDRVFAPSYTVLPPEKPGRVIVRVG